MRALAISTVVLILGISETGAAQPVKTGNSPARPGGSAAAGDTSPAAGERHGADRNAGDRVNEDMRRNRHHPRIVYVPGYGYTNWFGDYNNPYWSTPGTWYLNNGSPQTQPAQANTDATRTPARMEQDAAQAEMTAARLRVARQFESSGDVRAALRDVQDAQRAYDAAVADANRRLKRDPQYRQAEARKEEAAIDVEAAQAADRQRAARVPATQPAPISRELVNAAQQKLDAASKVTDIASREEQQDPAITDARRNLETATDRLNALKANFDTSLQADPQWQAARQKLDAPRAVGPR